MNISTGGPHILLFERDQQLAALLTSELQLTGYECHTARTAVEVFDAIARYAVRLVLVNLAQAAAARREFWVALDTQRRGSGVQVFTFHCTNLAGYGPRDSDEHNSDMLADMEVDGMIGLMGLVDAVRARIPDAEAMVNTMPRTPRILATSSNATTPMAAQRPGHAQPASVQNGNGMASYASQNGSSPVRPSSIRPTSQMMQQPQAPAPSMPLPQQNTGVPGIRASQMPYTPPAPPGPEAVGNGQSSPYNDKIRAVLYPSQRSWSSGPGSSPNGQDTRASQDTPMTYVPQGSNSPVVPNPSDSMLLRLANGRLDPNESGLEQLSRLARGNPATVREESSTIIYQPSEAETMTSGGKHTPGAPTPVNNNTSPARSIQFSEYAGSGPLNAVQPAPRPIPGEAPISAQPMRPAPIQDLPLERSTTPDGSRRPDVLSRANYGQYATSQAAPQPAPASQSPLASIATAATTPSSSTGPRTPMLPPSPSNNNDSRQASENIAPTATLSPQTDEKEKLDDNSTQPVIPLEKNYNEKNDENAPLDHNAVILNILQSLPPIPTLPNQQQGIQAQVLNGRATRSLGSVLLDGHLVPQDRLEVAHNIQRMLRGVDLNYQLGDILLMFKLLTPDQLLAASLVSYGLLTTTQISALGRIRQELHSIGLEYDLENLLILFRILTPEQLREVRANVQN